MNKLAMFVPLAKADAAQRLVFGYIDETPDRANEVMDYATAKPAFQTWSDAMAKASGGRSLGNIRAQHGKTAAGKLEKLDFNDEAKRIEFCAHIVDDQEWAKVEAGVYTGFSPGGSYAKAWQDGSYRRYTPKVLELSIVDVPCIPTGTFTMVKADGVEEEVEFVMDKAYEPGNDATKERAETLAKAAKTGTYKDYVIQARAELIGENALDALAKVYAGDEPAPEDEPADRLAALDAVLAKADETLRADDAAVTPLHVYAGAMTGVLLKADVEMLIAPPSPEAVALIGANIGQSFAAVAAIRSAVEPQLAKGMYALSDVVCSLQSFSWITQDVIWEASMEGDGSTLPQQAVDIVNAMKAFVIAMVEEEVSEMLARSKADAGTDVALVIEVADTEVMALAVQIVDLVKSNEPLMAKAGARNSAADATRIQAIHDKSCELGAGCADGGTVEKTASLAEENERLTKAIDGALPRLEELTKTVGELRTERETDRAEMVKMAEEIERLGGQPAPTKREQTISRSKEQDNGLEKVDDSAGPMTIEKANALPPAERSLAREQIARNLRHATPIPA